MLRKAICFVATLSIVLLLASCGGTSSSKAARANNDETKIQGAVVNTQLGSHYLKRGDLKLALSKLEKALSFDENYAPAHMVIAVIYETIGNDEAAEKHYRKSVDLLPKSGNGLNNLGQFLCARGRFEEADKFYSRALADPFYETPDVAYTNRGVCASKSGKKEIAESAFRKALNANPNAPLALFHMAHLLHESGDDFRARAFVQRYESVGPSGPEALALAYSIERKLGSTKTADDYYQRLRKQYPDSLQVRAIEGSRQGNE